MGVDRKRGHIKWLDFRYTRVLEGSPTTNNPVESWHSSVTADTKSHATLNVVLEEIQLEQAKTESHLIRLDAGEIYKKDVKRSRGSNRWPCKRYKYKATY